MLLIRKDQIEHATTRLLTQTQVNPEAGPKTFEEYVKIRYPYLETVKKREHEETIKRLHDAVCGGPLVISPVGAPAPLKSKMVTKVARNEVMTPNEPAARAASRLMQKIGKAIPL